MGILDWCGNELRIRVVGGRVRLRVRILCSGVRVFAHFAEDFTDLGFRVWARIQVGAEIVLFENRVDNVAAGRIDQE